MTVQNLLEYADLYIIYMCVVNIGCICILSANAHVSSDTATSQSAHTLLSSRGEDHGSEIVWSVLT
jgi:hypothetical protein